MKTFEHKPGNHKAIWHGRDDCGKKDRRVHHSMYGPKFFRGNISPIGGREVTGIGDAKEPVMIH